jgi:hypothetical protein
LITNALLSSSDQKERLSLAYVSALAAGAGFTYSLRDLDRDSIDITVHSRTSSFAAVAFQLKATSSPNWSADGLRFQLGAKNFNELQTTRQTPALLAVMVLPSDDQKWLTVTEKQLVLRRCVWWISLRGAGPTNQGSMQVVLPKANLLTVEALRELIAKSEAGTL